MLLDQHAGVTHHDRDRSTPGYVLVAPCGGTSVHLVDYDGNVLHTWPVQTGGVTFCAELLPNGNLWVNERAPVRKGVELTGSGLMREYDLNGEIVWEHYDPYQHHDAARLRRGGAAYLAYTDPPDGASAISGGVPNSESPVGICGEVIREVDESGVVVWERHLTEFGSEALPLHRNANRWSTGHTNTIVELDDGNYLVSSKVLNLVLIVDRQSGEIVWQFQDDAMGGQHDAQMLDNGNILVFANGAYSRDLHHSQVWEIEPRTNEVVWQYKAKDNPQSFFSPHIGGAQRLSSGNTLICEGAKGCIFEVTPDGDVVWQYICPDFNELPAPGFGKVNWLFRARHYLPGSPELSALPDVQVSL